MSADEAAWAVRDAVRANLNGPRDEWVSPAWLKAVIDLEFSQAGIR